MKKSKNHVKYCFIADMELLETLRKRTSVAQSWLIAQRAETNFDSFAQFCDKYNQGFCPGKKTYFVISDFLVLSWTSNREKLVMLSCLCQVFWQTTFLPLFPLFPSLFPDSIFDSLPDFPSFPFSLPFLIPFLTLPLLFPSPLLSLPPVTSTPFPSQL